MPSDPPGRTLASEATYERFGFVRACGCSPGFSVASSFRRRSRPLPRRPMTSAAFPARRTFHRRVLFPQCFAFRLTPPRASSRLRGHPPEELARFRRRPSPAHPTAVSPAAFANAITVIPHDEGCWSRSPFTHASKPELLAHASLDPAVTGFPAALLRGAGSGPSTSVTRLSNVGSRSTGAIHARHDDPCGVARTS